MGTLFVSVILCVLVTIIIVNMIKEKRSGKHPSCGGNCNSCGHACSYNSLKNIETPFNSEDKPIKITRTV